MTANRNNQVCLIYDRFAFDFNSPSDQAEEGVILTGLSARMSERVFFSRVPQQPSILRVTRVSACFLCGLVNWGVFFG